MALDSLSAVIQLYSTGLISRVDLEREAETWQSWGATSDSQPDTGRHDDGFIDLRPDANGVWTHA